MALNKIFKSSFVLVILLSVLLVVVAVHNSADQLKPMLSVREQINESKLPNTIIIGQKGRFKVELAATLEERTRGLSNRVSLPNHWGMVFLFNKPDRYGFWMKEMRFPLDIIWIENNRVVGISENLLPEGVQPKNIYYPPATADTILEVNAGQARALGITTGDVVKLGYEE
jgi:uncharacterized protein